MSRLIIATCLLAGVIAVAQAPETFKVRLTPVSMDAAMKVNIAGSGSGTAVLARARLTVSGSFDGLLSPATTARIHRGSVTGVRGPAIFELKVSSMTSGTVSGTFDLTNDQVESLRKGRLYVQIASEKAPDGNLWGWLLP
jgi:hypothetical protein